MRAALASCLLLLAGCGGGGDAGNRLPDENQLRRLTTPQKEVVDPEAPARPRALAPGDLAAAGLVPACDFRIGERMLFAVSAEDAIARIAGNLQHFVHSAPVGPTGGFFEDRQISVSVGRISEIVPGESAAGSWPARITITNRRAGARVELTGIWRCG
jgi:hypothetical protein